MSASRTSSSCWAVVGSVAVLAADAGPSRAATFHVPSSYPTIQAGIDAAAAGDTVLVAPGVYEEYETRGTFTSCAFLKAGVVVRSQAGPGATTMPLTHMTGPQRVGVLARLLESEDTAFEGFTLIGPNALGIFIFYCDNVKVSDCVFRDFDGGPTSGGAAIVNGDATFVNCKFEKCVANSAGAMWHSSGHITLDKCTIRECGDVAIRSTETGGNTGSADIVNCTFIDNWADGAAGALSIGAAFGGSTISGCTFIGNLNTGVGAGALSLGPGPKSVLNCVFIENKAFGGNGRGGGLSGFTGINWLTIRGNTFVDNAKVVNAAPGGSIDIGPNTILEDNIFVGSENGAAVSADFGDPSSRCNVFWDNPFGAGIPLTTTNREVDPLFCDRGRRDLTLREGSPCLPGDPLGCGLIGAFGEGCGTVSVQPTSWGAIKGLYR